MLKLKNVYPTQAEYKDTNVFERRQNKKICEADLDLSRSPYTSARIAQLLAVS
jgi:hypothetical protein